MNTKVVTIGVICGAAMFALAGTASAGEQASGRQKVQTARGAQHPTARPKLQTQNAERRNQGTWAKVDGLKAEFETIERSGRSSYGKSNSYQILSPGAQPTARKVYSQQLTFTLSTTQPAPPTETLDIAHAGFLDDTAPRASGKGSNEIRSEDSPGAARALPTPWHAATPAQTQNAGEVAVEGITLVHEGFEIRSAAFNPKEIALQKSVPWQPSSGLGDGTSSTLMIGEATPK